MTFKPAWKRLFATVSIRTRVLLLLAVVAVPFVVLEVSSAIEDWRGTIETAAFEIREDATATAAGLSEFISGLRGSLEALAREDAEALLQPAGCRELIQTVARGLPAFTHMGVADSNARPVCVAAPMSANADSTLLAWFQRIERDRAFHVSPPMLGPITGEWIVILGVPILDEEGAFRGVVSGSVQLHRIQNLVERVRPTGDRMVTVGTVGGVIVARSHDPEQWVGQRFPPMSVVTETLSSQRFITESVDLDGRDRVWGRVDIAEPPWRVFVGIPRDDVYGPRLLNLQTDIATNLLVLVFAVVLALFLVHGITRSFTLLAEGVGDAELGRPVPVPAGAPPEVTLIATRVNQTLDAIERAEAAERAAHERYHQIVDNAVFGIYVSRMDGRFLQVNPAFLSMTGYNSAEGLMSAGAEALYKHPGRRPELMMNSLDEGRIENIVVEWRRKDGRPLIARLNGSIVTLPGGDPGFEVIVEDITRQRDLEELTRHQQKMEAVGRLAGGVAHEFNNLLTVLGVSTEILTSSLGEDDPRRVEATDIQVALERAGALTRKLLAFSRKEVTQPRVLNLDQVLLDLEGMLHRVLGDHIQLVMKDVDNAWTVTIDPGHIEQVILNLTLNARDSMPTGGKIELGTECRAAFPRSSGPGERSDPKWYAVLTVKDDGPGMAPGVQAHIFEPFFTTKPVGEGTGLGLSTVHGIVTENGGWIEVETEPGAGSLFRVWLPLTHDAPPRLPSSRSRGRETLLIAVDDAALRHMVRLALEPLGFEVLEAESTSDALDLFWRSNRTPDLLVTSSDLAPLSGRSLLDRLREERPSLDAVLLGQGELALPFEPSVLATHVRDALDRSR